MAFPTRGFQKLAQEFAADPSEMWRLQAAEGDPKVAELSRGQEDTRQMSERGELRLSRRALGRKCMADKCPKCGMPAPRFWVGQMDFDPWRSWCASKSPDEYHKAKADWIPQNRALVLQRMGVPIGLRACTFENFEAENADQRKTLRSVRNWADQADEGLYLCGPVGTGKTHLAVAGLLAQRADGLSARFVTAQELIFLCRDEIRRGEGLEEILEVLRRPDVLLLDDLGVENSTDFSREVFGTVIDRVVRDCSPLLIVTSNYDLDGLAEKLDARNRR